MDTFDDMEEQKRLLACIAEKYSLNKENTLFLQVREKLNSEEKLTDSEWDYVIKRLCALSLKAVLEEENIDLLHQFTCLIARIGVFIFEKYGRAYNDCYKALEVLTSFEKEKEINSDLLYGVGKVSSSKKEENLRILLKQYDEAKVFYQNQSAYVEAYTETKSGEISPNEKLFIHAYNQAYQEEKKLVKRLRKQ